MTRLLKIDPRPPAYDSVAEASVDTDAAVIIDDSVEMGEWRPVTPPMLDAVVDLAFVDGVQNLEARVAAVDDAAPDVPGQGIVVSYAAGALFPRREPAIEVALTERRVILGAGRKLDRAIALQAQNGEFRYEAASCAENTSEALAAKFMHMRAELEARVVGMLLEQQCELIVVDGRLPPVVSPHAVGLIKTPHHIPLSAEQANVLSALTTGQRSPVFKRERSGRLFYDWFLCLRTPGTFDSPWSGLALLEMDDAVGAARARTVADVTAALLPKYASTPSRDARAPQNLLPVGQLERDLRRRLGDPLLLHRLLRRCIGTEATGWA
jgi:hypothetical protein